MKTTITVLLADDHPVVLAGLAQYLRGQGFTISALAENVEALMKAVVEAPGLDIVVTDYSFGGEHDGFRMLERLRRLRPDVKLVVFSRVRQIGLIRQILAYEVDAFVSKTVGLEFVAQACRAVSGGSRYLDPATRRTLHPTSTPEAGADAKAAYSPEGSLSPREREVIRLLGEGLTIREIADCFRRSPKTVSVQKCAAMSKLGLKTDIELALYLASLEDK